jgi:hypothetical protein
VNAWKIVCATLVIFVAGIVTGATLVRFAQRGAKPFRNPPPVVMGNRAQPKQVNPDGANATRPAAGLLSREFIQILDRKLRLTSEQRERIDQIMADGQERVRELRANLEPEMRQELQQTREQIRTVLTREQREQFEQLMKRPARRNERNDVPGQPNRRLQGPREPPRPADEPRDEQP